MTAMPLDNRTLSRDDQNDLSSSALRRFAGLQDGPVPENFARSAGRRMAMHPLLAPRTTQRDEALATVLHDAQYLLGAFGIQLDVLRTRSGCAVLRSYPSNNQISAASACELVKGLLETVTEAACNVPGTVLETTCAARAGAACLHTLIWEGSAPNYSTHTSPPVQAEPQFAAPPVGAPPAYEPAPNGQPDAIRASADRLTERAVLGNTVLYADPASAAPPTAYRYMGEIPSPSARSQSTPTPFPAGSQSREGGPAPSPSVQAQQAQAFQAQALQAQALQAQALQAQQAEALQTRQAPAPAAVLNQPHPTGASANRARMRWVARRGWLLVAAVLAGSGGGWYAGHRAVVTYTAEATLVVQSGASSAGPGNANDAQALATNYAALIPTDQQVLRSSAQNLGVSESTVKSRLSVSVPLGTSLLDLKYTAPTSSAAISGSSLIAQTIASSSGAGAAIPPGSVVVVNLPSSASRGGTLNKYGLPIGGILGLLLGAILVIAAERTDPRVDDAQDLAVAVGCPATGLPNDATLPELSRALVAASGPSENLTIVPLTVPDTGPVMELVKRLITSWPMTGEGPAMAVTPSFDSGAVELARGRGPTVLAMRAGVKQRDVSAAAERLRVIGRAPVWAVLLNRRALPNVSAHGL